jgi:bacterioferritin-associated ferredoxin
VIICSCNVLSEAQILAALERGAKVKRRTPGEAYRCLGCAPRCGRCLATVRALLAKAHLDKCNVGCASCPAAQPQRHGGFDDAPPELVPALIAAE